MLYAWARNAPQLVLPPDVGFMVGRDSDVQYLVLQVYLDIYTEYLPRYIYPDICRFTTPVWTGSPPRETGLV